MNITYTAVVSPGANQWYGSMVLSNICYEDGSPVQLNQFLALDFQSPASVTSKDIYPTLTVWSATTVDAQSAQIDATTYSVAARLNFDAPHAINAHDQITIGVNGDLTQDADRYLKSFVIAADRTPEVTGTVSVDCAACPDPALAASPPTLTFAYGALTSTVQLAYGQTTQVTLPQGTYAIRGDNVETADQTVSAPLVIGPQNVTVTTGQATRVSVGFGPMQRYAALDVEIGTLTGLATETLHVTLTDTVTGQTLASFVSGVATTTALRRLPATGLAVLSIDDIALNDLSYRFAATTVTLANRLQTLAIDNTDVRTVTVDTSGFVNVPVNVVADLTRSRQTTLRLTGDTMNYTQIIDIKSQNTAFAAPVKPGDYAVTATSFISDGLVIAVSVPATLNVKADGSTSLNVSVEASANLNVPGFPAYLSFGGCADLTPGNAADFVSARASSVFKYAGNDGAGDANVYLSDDPATTTTINLARSIESQLGNVQPVLPVLISYTCNLSLGNTPGQLANADQHAHSFANYILSLNLANQAIDASHPVPAGYVINPDFLGACQQANLGPDYSMPVRAPLQTALDHWSVKAAIPAGITDTIRGYVAAVNWLTRTIAPNVVFGWQVNLWGVGRSEWIYEDADPATFAQQTATYLQSLGGYDGDAPPDFLAIDRYEADDFTQRAYVNGYCYGPREWQRFFDFCETMSRALKLPVMPWQIPASRTPVTTDAVNMDFDSQHWGTGGSYLLGDAAVGSDYRHVHPNILALSFPPAFQADMGNTAEDMFKRSEPFDITDPAYGDFPLRGIFAVLLGGGATTGIISTVGNAEPWVRNRLNAYMDAPVRFDA
ncbi:hypothetical protein [Paraburkholderia sp.]|uniref:hypothetical protein n=1 Tax=Paraburkholderia sp. TaxID=1926495 RepID=UPI00238D82A6|nr:hypothetical protein [Paraburkholderia sp.]MDE1183078.1 hypothetical protein [Paraburkholderia sp.]